jgi:hypothetical protein
MKYFTFSHITVTDDAENTPDAIKYKAISKFEPKVLAWCAISEAGVSTPFIRTVKSQAVVDADVYFTICLPKMVEFIEKHHKKDETMQRKR